MIIKELIRRLQAFDENHDVNIEIDAECGCLKCESNIEDVQFKNMKCVLYGQTD